jgi:hypothetical protein
MSFFTPMGMFVGQGAGTPASSGWSAADKGAGVTVSTDGKTATYPGGGGRMIRGTQVKQSGKRYAEIKMNGGASAGNHVVGVATSAAALSNYLGADAFGWGTLNISGSLVGYNNNTQSSGSGPAATVASTMMIAMDDAGNLWLGADGNWRAGSNPATGVAPTFTGVSASVYLAGSAGEASNDAINTGGSAFAYTPPSGFSAWG